MPNEEDLIHWLRNGNDNVPFVLPHQITKVASDLLVTFAGSNPTKIMVEGLEGRVYAPLDDSGEIIWEDWNIVKRELLNESVL